MKINQEEYEYKTGTFDWATALRRAFHGESEETEMKKDIEWLKEEIGDLPTTSAEFINDGLNYIDSAIPVTGVYDLIDQLDEPEDERIKELESYNDDLIRYTSQLKNELNELESYNDELILYNNQLLNVMVDREVLSQGRKDDE